MYGDECYKFIMLMFKNVFMDRVLSIISYKSGAQKSVWNLSPIYRHVHRYNNQIKNKVITESINYEFHPLKHI